MKNKFKVEQTMQPGGLMWAVVFERQYRFINKSKKNAERLAERLNKIQERRLSEEA